MVCACVCVYTYTCRYGVEVGEYHQTLSEEAAVKHMQMLSEISSRVRICMCDICMYACMHAQKNLW